MPHQKSSRASLAHTANYLRLVAASFSQRARDIGIPGEYNFVLLRFFISPVFSRPKEKKHKEGESENISVRVNFGDHE